MGITTTIGWHWGTNSVIDFNAATDVLDFGWFSSENFTVSEKNGSTVISIPSNNQSYTLSGVTLSKLTTANIVAKDASALTAWQKAIGSSDTGATSGGTVTQSPTTPTSGSNTTQNQPTATKADPIVHDATPVTPVHESTATSSTISINWSWGSHAKVAFDPAKDKLDFSWFSANNFKISEVDGSVVITIPSNDQTYTLTGVGLSQLSAINIIAKDASTIAAWSDAFGKAAPVTDSANTGSTGTTATSGTGGSTENTGTSGSTDHTAAAPSTGTTAPTTTAVQPGDTGTTVSAGNTGNAGTTETKPTTPAPVAGGDTAPSTTTTPDTTTSAPSNGGKAAYTAAWDATHVYNGGDLASVGNSVYKAKWWTSGDDPSTHSNSVWSFVGYMDTTPVAPDAPAHLQAVGTRSASTVLSWDTAVIQGPGKISGYNIYENDTLVATSTDNYFKVTGLNPSTEYKFSVTAVDEAGTSLPSNEITITTRADDAGALNKTFSPYIDMSLTTSQHLVDMASKAGLSEVTLAFLQSSGTDQVGWGGTGSIQNDALSNGTTISSIVDKLHSSGVDVTISFGGAVGQEAAAKATSVAALTATYQSVIDKYHVNHLDFDVEGAAIADTAANATRSAALVALEKANPDLTVSFTLPVLTDGMTLDGIKLLQAAKDAGVHVNTVNIMAMDYGAGFDTGDMGRDAITAAKSTLDQIQKIGLDAHLVITPMIGINDVTSEVFTLNNARHLVDYVQSNDNIDGIAMWSLGRDNGNTVGAVSPVGSGVQQDDFAFSQIFNTVHSSHAHDGVLV